MANAVDFGASREHWGAASNTSVASDTKGNAYLSCMLFTRSLLTVDNHVGSPYQDRIYVS